MRKYYLAVFDDGIHTRQSEADYKVCVRPKYADGSCPGWVSFSRGDGSGIRKRGWPCADVVPVVQITHAAYRELRQAATPLAQQAVAVSWGVML